MAPRTWITLAAVAGLLTVWLQRREGATWRNGRFGTGHGAGQDRANGAAARAVHDHAPSNTMSPAHDLGSSIAAARTDDLLSPTAQNERASAGLVGQIAT